MAQVHPVQYASRRAYTPSVPSSTRSNTPNLYDINTTLIQDQERPGSAAVSIPTSSQSTFWNTDHRQSLDRPAMPESAEQPPRTISSTYVPANGSGSASRISSAKHKRHHSRTAFVHSQDDNTSSRGRGMKSASKAADVVQLEHAAVGQIEVQNARSNDPVVDGTASRGLITRRFVNRVSLDDCLQTQVARAEIIPAYSAPGRSEQTEARYRHHLRHVFRDARSASKKRAVDLPLGDSVPRWSRTSQFKERLDALFGPGDIDRGIGPEPVAVSSDFDSQAASEKPDKVYTLRDAHALCVHDADENVAARIMSR